LEEGLPRSTSYARRQPPWHFPTEREAARIRLFGSDGKCPRILSPDSREQSGSEWDFDCALREFKSTHKKAQVAHAIALNPGICDKGVFYDAAFNLPESLMVSRATVEISLPPPASLWTLKLVKIEP
jgi:hypothetical protein